VPSRVENSLASPEPVRGVRRSLESVAVYRLWQAPFQGKKFAPILRHNDLRQARRVLDVGCGPAINTAFFSSGEYLGLDINPRYISYARRRTGREFLVADMTKWAPEGREGFDFVLVNSYFHHVDDHYARQILQRLPAAMAPGAHIHIVDLVLPQRPGIARTLARWDRGQYARPLEQWRSLFGEFFEEVVFEPYAIRVAGVALWELLYFKGARRR
jgi:SAM-dependent methyltransferase